MPGTSTTPWQLPMIVQSTRYTTSFTVPIWIAYQLHCHMRNSRSHLRCEAFRLLRYRVSCFMLPCCMFMSLPYRNKLVLQKYIVAVSYGYSMASRLHLVNNWHASYIPMLSAGRETKKSGISRKKTKAAAVSKSKSVQDEIVPAFDTALHARYQLGIQSQIHPWIIRPSLDFQPYVTSILFAVYPDFYSQGYC